MLADITGSNFPPTAKEEGVLRLLLKQKEDELNVAAEHVNKARTSVTSSTDAIQKLTKSREFAVMTVDVYNTHIKNLKASLELLETQFNLCHRDAPGPDPMPCVALSDLLTPDIHKRRANATLEIGELEEILAKVNASILDIDEELRCQRYVNQVNTESLKSYLVVQKRPNLSLMEYLARFDQSNVSQIKFGRKLWASRSLKQANGFRRLRPPPFSYQPYRSHMYAELGGDEPNRNYIDIWKRLSGQEPLTVFETQCTASTSAAQILGHYLLNRSKELFYEVLQLKDGVPNDLNPDEDHKYAILALVLHAPPLSQNTKVQARLYSQFSSVQALLLSDLLPHRGLTLQDSLTFLSITFSRLHKSYKLARLLIPSLGYLSLQHFEANGTPDLTETIQLPNLRSLDITPIEYKLVEKLEVPKLSCLTLSSPVKLSASPDGWLDSIITLCANIVDLEIDCSPAKKCKEIGDTTRFDVLQILTQLRPQMPKLRQVKVVGSVFEGRGLADILEKKENGGVHIRKLEELTIDNCVGVSQMDCERLVQLVGKLDVYRTFHKDGKL